METIIIGKINKNHVKYLIENQIKYKNYINISEAKLINCYNQARVLLFPSLYEGFGMPVVEAMSLGCPVICSNTSSLPEINGSNALSYSPYSEDELLKKMIEITQDKDF